MALLATSITSYDWGLIWQYHSQLLHGLLVALEVAASAMLLSLVFGLVLAVLRMAPRPITWIAAVYVNIFRGIPALVSVIWVYFGLSLVIGINFTVYEAGVIALTLLYSAYI